ncbi:MAG: MlaD family protein [Paracoccus sp. (in: a-proteobacteria)]|uniref:MlaD family protein n=1 Tax=Paracoccus sp. TaxID=267 RepID=UPI0026DFA575|nr:MlaD family protein [Paracoccus sp. (in: a-proteobacteria)]MDO5620301.1 MlaD family protein [Paracoccus sp. (in: a-proteobacteria)]
MENKANYVLIGGFTIAGFLGILGFLLWFANYETNRQFDYYDVYFTEVSGLDIASQVRFAGLPVGQVVDMALSEQQQGRVRVRLEVRADTPVRRNSTAALEAQGVTGLSIVGITPGNPNAPLLMDGTEGVPVIPATRSVLQTLGDQGPEIIERLNTVADQLTQLLGTDNQQRVANILTNVEHSSANLDQALNDLSAAANNIARVADEFAGVGDKIVPLADGAGQALISIKTAADSATGALNEAQDYMAGDLRRLSDQVTQTAADLSALSASATPAIDSATRALDGADRIINTEVGPVAQDLRASLARLNTTLERVNADLPTILGRVRGAAESAQAAAGQVQVMVARAAPGVEAFTREGLPQFAGLARDLRSVTRDISDFVRVLRRSLRL